MFIYLLAVADPNEAMHTICTCRHNNASYCHALAPRLLTIDTVSATLKSIEALEKKKHRHMLIPGYPYYYTLLVCKHLQDWTGPRFRSRFGVGIFVSCLDGDGWDGGVSWYGYGV